MPETVLSTLCAFIQSKNPKKPVFCRWENWGFKGSGNLPQIIYSANKTSQNVNSGVSDSKPVTVITSSLYSEIFFKFIFTSLTQSSLSGTWNSINILWKDNKFTLITLTFKVPTERDKKFPLLLERGLH